MRTFGELADSFIDTVKFHENLSDRIDVFLIGMKNAQSKKEHELLEVAV